MKKGSRSKGAVLIELALLSPILVLLVLGAIHFGYLFYIYNQLEKSVREGARYGASRTFVDFTTYENVVKQVVVCGTVGDCGADAIVPGLAMGHVTVETIPAGVRPERIRVGISGYQYQGVLDWLVGPLTLNKPSMEMPYFGRYAPPVEGGGGGK